MRNLHIILGRRTLSQDSDPVSLYVGIDGDAAIAARDSALASGEFTAVETVPYHCGVLRYADPDLVANFKPCAEIRDATADDLYAALQESEAKLAAAAAAHAELVAANEALKASDAESADKIVALTIARDEARTRIAELEDVIAKKKK